MTYRPYSQISSSVDLSTIKTSLLNTSGLTILKHIPVRINSNGDIMPVDVAIEADIFSLVGISNNMISTGNYGDVVTQGRVEDIDGFDFGEYVYISKTGGLTNILPDEGSYGFVSGDWVVKVGVIAKNPSDPILKDLIVNMQIIGQL
jgi:hypothetical protein